MCVQTPCARCVGVVTASSPVLAIGARWMYPPGPPSGPELPYIAHTRPPGRSFMITSRQLPSAAGIDELTHADIVTRVTCCAAEFATDTMPVAPSNESALPAPARPATRL